MQLFEAVEIPPSPVLVSSRNRARRLLRNPLRVHGTESGGTFVSVQRDVRLRILLRCLERSPVKCRIENINSVSPVPFQPGMCKPIAGAMSAYNKTNVRGADRVHDFVKFDRLA